MVNTLPPGPGCAPRTHAQSTLFFIGRLLIGGGQFFWTSLLVLILWHPIQIILGTYELNLPSWFLISLTLVYLIGGLSIVLGYWTRSSCCLLILLGALLLCWKMSFWTAQGYQRPIIEMLVMNYLMIIGGMIYLITCGPGGYAPCCREGKWVRGPRLTAGLIFIARFLIGGVFVWHGVSKIGEWPIYHGLLLENQMTTPELILVIAATVETLGGLCILFGWKVRIVALILAIYFLFILIASWGDWEISVQYLVLIPSPVQEWIFEEEVLSASYLLRMKFFADHLAIFGTLLLLMGCPKLGYHAEIRISSGEPESDH